MKIRLLFAAILVSSIGSVYAQNYHIARMGAYDLNSETIIGQPSTMLAVDITSEREVIVSGPYARYAQKYLGVRAPLTDKSNYTIKSASLSIMDNDGYYTSMPQTASTLIADDYAGTEAEFARLLPDKMDMTVVGLDEAAKTAAQAIFSLRKRRVELITGEAGENVFGEGLKAALAEIDKLERSYLELFLGKRSIAIETCRYAILPKPDEKQYIVCRFSPKDGLLPLSDLSGEVVLLQITPTGNMITVNEAGEKDTNAISVRLADYANCTLLCGNSEIAKATLPIFEFGRTVRISMPKKR